LTTTLIMLDLTSAFDTIDHQILLDRLNGRYGIGATALIWFRSYLANRRQAVTINGHSSNTVALRRGVPQGSVLGPILFTLYLAPLADIIKLYDLSYMLHADDAQIYVSTSTDHDEVMGRIQSCIGGIRQWMAANRLKLNDGKTDVINFSSQFRPQSVIMPRVKFGELIVDPSNSVKNLGVILDENLAMTEHINAVVKSAYFYIYSIGKIRRHLDKASTQRLVHSLVTSRLDYANSSIINVPLCERRKLQRVQNCAARLVSLIRRRDHVTPVVREYHVLMFVFGCLTGTAPVYLTDLIRPVSHYRSLRSNNCNLHVPRTKTRTYGDRAFSVIGPRLWNSLPSEFKNISSQTVFKSKFKTYLFTKAFN
jgi:hypothetical protein